MNPGNGCLFFALSKQMRMFEAFVTKILTLREACSVHGTSRAEGCAQALLLTAVGVREPWLLVHVQIYNSREGITV